MGVLVVNSAIYLQAGQVEGQVTLKIILDKLDLFQVMLEATDLKSGLRWNLHQAYYRIQGNIAGGILKKHDRIHGGLFGAFLNQLADIV